ncbi:hypothetical protein [Bradyrhizobium genosp. SA-3]|uniref:hypothetical protein n=1 Tax=Bradyrhizobium genosp. SA-3 TaxID=508868 RepID=UPI001FE051CB|nr:hypothetical protein [Bradyrhizobium genosp. SA-3]
MFENGAIKPEFHGYIVIGGLGGNEPGSEADSGPFPHLPAAVIIVLHIPAQRRGPADPPYGERYEDRARPDLSGRRRLRRGISTAAQPLLSRDQTGGKVGIRPEARDGRHGSDHF